MKRIVLLTVAIFFSVTACGNGGTDPTPGVDIPGGDTPTVDLDSQQEYDEWQNPISAKCGVLEASEEFEKCTQDEMIGTKLIMSGPVIFVLGEEFYGGQPSQVVTITVGSNNSRLRPSNAKYLGKEELAPYEFDLLCPRSVAGCATVTEGDQVRITAVLDNRPHQADPGLSPFIESITVN